jgi:hypothetical protein
MVDFFRRTLRARPSRFVLAFQFLMVWAEAAIIWVVPVCWATAAANDANPPVDNPILALANLSQGGRSFAFEASAHALPDGGHLQGIQAFHDIDTDRHFCFLSHDSERVAYFVTVEFQYGSQRSRTDGEGQILQRQNLPSDGRLPSLRHAGGMQRIGDYLVIGVEDNQLKCRSQIQFWDISEPLEPRIRAPLTVTRESERAKSMTAGAVGIVKRQTDHLLIVANWDAEDLDFYTSNGLPLGDDGCRFEFKMRWSQKHAEKSAWVPDKDWGGYQALNLVADSESQIFILGFYTVGNNEDIIDIFSLDLARENSEVIRKVGSKRMQLASGAHFRYAGGIDIRSPKRLDCYASEHNMRRSQTHFLIMDMKTP